MLQKSTHKEHARFSWPHRAPFTTAYAIIKMSEKLVKSKVTCLSGQLLEYRDEELCG